MRKRDLEALKSHVIGRSEREVEGIAIKLGANGITATDA